MVYDTIALPTELTKHGRMFYTGYHPAIGAADPFLPVPSDSHIGGFCVVLSPAFFTRICNYEQDFWIPSGTVPVCLFY